MRALPLRHRDSPTSVQAGAGKPSGVAGVGAIVGVAGGGGAAGVGGGAAGNGASGGAGTDGGRSVRIGGQSVAPGEARALALALPGRVDHATAIPVWLAVGKQNGPRVTIAAAPRGFEVAASAAAGGLRARLDPATLNGSVVVVPVLRPGGWFAARGRPVRDAAAWRFPGDPGGNLRAREAFAVFSELVVGSSLLLLVSAPDPRRAGALTLRGDLDDPRVRRLVQHVPGAAVMHAKHKSGGIAAAATEMGVVALELSAANNAVAGVAEAALLDALLAILDAHGVVPPSVSPRARARVPTIKRLVTVRALAGGLLENAVRAGQLVERGALLARVVPLLAGSPSEIRSPHDALVVEASTGAGVRARAVLFVLGRVSRAAVARDRARARADAPAAARSRATNGLGAQSSHVAGPMRIGWVERVSLPALGVDRLRAKIDTGARTSALHVTSMIEVGTTDGPHRRTILEVTIPGGSRRGGKSGKSFAVRVQVRDHVQVKDTSGRSELRPVIETTLRLGTLVRRIRVTLTNRGDMLFPMLIGRTALGSGVVVDPSRRLLVPAVRGHKS